MAAQGRQLLQTTKHESLWGDRVITMVGPHGENVTSTCSVNPRPNFMDMYLHSSACLLESGGRACHCMRPVSAVLRCIRTRPPWNAFWRAGLTPDVRSLGAQALRW